jgi:hypothetical protein
MTGRPFEKDSQGTVVRVHASSASCARSRANTHRPRSKNSHGFALKARSESAHVAATRELFGCGYWRFNQSS